MFSLSAKVDQYIIYEDHHKVVEVLMENIMHHGHGSSAID